ncbi:MAG: hypothetical protein CL940_00200 [Deltaproteobacteria bacterium]|nr:hypothetical protein [Deltaproteobacteria bacterium]
MKLTPHLMPVQLDAKNIESAETEGPPFELPEDTWSEDAKVQDRELAQDERTDLRDHDAELREQRERRPDEGDREERREFTPQDDRSEERERDDAPVFAKRLVREERAPSRRRREVERTDVALLLNQDLEDRRAFKHRDEGARPERTAIRQDQGDANPRLAIRQESNVAREAVKATEATTVERPTRAVEQRPTEERIAGSKLESVDRPREERLASKVETRATAADKLAQLRAVTRNQSRARDINIARDLLQNVREARMDESRAVDRTVRATQRGEAVHTALTENVAKEVHNVFKKASEKRTQHLEAARESYRAAEEGLDSTQDEVNVAATTATQSNSIQTPVVATQSVTAVSASASANAVNTASTMGLDPEVSEALRNVRIEDPGDTVLRLNETDAGQLEVRIRANGDDLMVLVKAEEQALRQKMLDGLPDVRKALDRAELVAGRVDVAEYGAFENEARGDGDDHQFFENAFEDSLDQQASDDGEPRQEASGSPTPENAPSSVDAAQRSPIAEDGRLHVIV